MTEKMNKVLIVDDDRMNIIGLSSILDPEYTVYTARNGIDAIASAKKYLPDVILLDIVMPEMDGYATILKLKQSATTAQIPVIFISGLDDEIDEERGIYLGAAEYITKPFSAAIVKLRVKNQLRLRGK